MLSEELNSNVVARSKLDEVNRKLEKFAYTTAHDLKSPLNSVNGLIGLLESSLNAGDLKEAEEYITLLKAITNKMKTLVQGILDYSKVDASKVDRVPIDLNLLFKDVIETDQLAPGADIKIVGTLPIVLFNLSALEQVVRNLLHNAVKYSDKELCQIVVRSRDRGDHFQISVADNGPGIPAENHEKIFELFYHSGSISSEGHGIGLATIKSVLDAAGERVWVESSLGKGATFHFTLKKQK
jgi:signal transduction histidine kinase